MRANALAFVHQHHANLRAFAWDAERARRLDLLWWDMRGATACGSSPTCPPYHPLVWETVRRDDRAMAGLALTRTALADLAGTHARAACMGRGLAHLHLAAP